MKLQTLALMALLVLPAGVSANAEQATAKILSVTGTVTATIPGQGKKQIHANDLVPVGTEISTTGGTVLIGLTPGAGSIIEEGSQVSINKLNFEKKGKKVVKREIELGLDNEKASVISFLKKLDGVSDFSVRTPHGVAAARGTVWRTTSNTVQVLNGVVTMTVGGVTVSVPAGNAGNMDGGGVTGLTDEQLQELLDKLKAYGVVSKDATFEDFTNSGGEDNTFPVFDYINPEAPPTPPTPPAPPSEDPESGPLL